LADISGLPGKNGKDRAMYLLQNTGIAFVSGKAFYHDDNRGNLARFCFAKNDPALEEACRRIEGLSQ
jgi:aminotransferase